MGKFERGAGILLHPTSLPSNYGIGELGGAIYKFIDFLVETDQKFWQILPLGPTGYGDSPYQSLSSFAGNPLLVSIEELIQTGLLEDDQVPKENFSDKRVEYGGVIPFKHRLLRLAYEKYKETGLMREEFTKFMQNNAEWLDDFALFYSLKQQFELAAWSDWPEEYRDPTSFAVADFATEETDKLNEVKFIQFLFRVQWDKVKSYANDNGIKVIGDIPIFVAFDSVDCWVNQDLFLMGENGKLQYVAGVPPDYFSATGQLWGNPIYDWERCKKTGYKFWTNRIKWTLDLVDIIRIDHFRGFEAYWRVPAEATTAIDGKWVKGPGESLFQHLKDELGELPLIAEDLGVITPEVTALREKFGMPGMKIIQYGFSRSKDPDNGYLPHNFEDNCVAYSGTHDNDTTLGWFTTASKEIKQHFIDYTNSDGSDIVSDMIHLASGSVANLVIFPLQDVLRKKSEARMNFPGKAYGNWQWRFQLHELKEEWKMELKECTDMYNRN